MPPAAPGLPNSTAQRLRACPPRAQTGRRYKPREDAARSLRRLRRALWLQTLHFEDEPQAQPHSASKDRKLRVLAKIGGHAREMEASVAK